MKPKKGTYRCDIDPVLEQVLDEAIVQVMEQFDDSVASLEPENRKLIQAFFDGRTVEQLAVDHHTSVHNMQACIDRIRKDLGKNLRSKFRVKQ